MENRSNFSCRIVSDCSCKIESIGGIIWCPLCGGENWNALALMFNAQILGDASCEGARIETLKPMPVLWLHLMPPVRGRELKLLYGWPVWSMGADAPCVGARIDRKKKSKGFEPLCWRPLWGARIETTQKGRGSNPAKERCPCVLPYSGNFSDLRTAFYYYYVTFSLKKRC